MAHNNTGSLFLQSLKMALNRSSTQVASILVTAILGLYSTQVLAEFGLALAFASILFVMVTTLQLGIQAEFGRKFISKDYIGLGDMFWATGIVVLGIAGILALTVLLMPNPFSHAASSALAYGAYGSLRVLVLSLPVVAVITTITFFLESLGKIAVVAKLRMAQLWVQTGLVLAVITLSHTQLGGPTMSVRVALAYVASDTLILLAGIALLIRESNKKNVLPILSLPQTLPKIQEIMTVLKFGFPVTLGLSAQRFVFYLCTSFMAGLGVMQASAFSIINSLIFFSQIPLLGLAHLLTIKIGHARGARDSVYLKKVSMETARLFVIELLILGIILVSLQPYIARMFTHDAELISFLVDQKAVILLFFIMNAALTFSMSALRGFSDNLYPQLILISVLLIGFVPWLYLFPEYIDFGETILLFAGSGIAAASILFLRLAKAKQREVYD